MIHLTVVFDWFQNKLYKLIKTTINLLTDRESRNNNVEIMKM